MNYVEWNNIISEYFFNPANAGRNIHLSQIMQWIVLAEVYIF